MQAFLSLTLSAHSKHYFRNRHQKSTHIHARPRGCYPRCARHGNTFSQRPSGLGPPPRQRTTGPPAGTFPAAQPGLPRAPTRKPTWSPLSPNPGFPRSSVAVLLAHLPQTGHATGPGIRVLRQPTTNGSAGSPAPFSPNLATSHQFRKFAGLTALRTRNVLSLRTRPGALNVPVSALPNTPLT